MGRRSWQGFVGMFAVAVGVASCSGSDTTGSLPDGSVGPDGGAQRHDGARDSTSGNKPDGKGHQGDGGAAVDAGCDGPCANGHSCKLPTDCASQSCQAGKCVAPTCTDGVKDGMESDVDCGGPSCMACPTGDKCGVTKDCQSLVCTGGVCIAPTDTDGVKNDSETDVDCGGGLLASGQPNPASDGAPVCAVGKTCTIGADCVQGVCAVSVPSPDGGVGDGGRGDAGRTGDGGAGVLTCQPATDKDGVKNDSETDVDCGGALLADGTTNPASDGAPACGAMKACKLASDCVSLVCTNDVCQAATATDMVKNDSETDVDCGGAKLASGGTNPASDGAPGCATGKTCVLGTDCLNLVCFTGVVTTPSPDGSPINCPAGMTCTCQAPTSTDGVANDSETDVDCGGDFVAGGGANAASDQAKVCAVGKKCLLGTDCAEGVCNSTNGAGVGPTDCPAGDMCTCQTATSTDHVKNDSETDVDCGGALLAGGAMNPASDGAPACVVGKGCLLGLDCTGGVCNDNVGAGPFTAPIALDCPAGKTCTCQAPAPNDAVQNDSETDVDCGGATLASGAANPASDGAPGCNDVKSCALDTDCLSGFCSTLSHTCVAGQSCKGIVTPAKILNVTGTNADGDATGAPNANGVGQSAGIDTCGSGESTDPIAQQAHESCCKSLVTPGFGACPCSTGETCIGNKCVVRLDKYEVTSGRMRQFIEAVNAQMTAENGNNPPYDVRDWATEQIAKGTAAGKTLTATIPSGANGTTANVIALLPQSYYGALNVIEELGGTTMDANYPSQFQGCYTADGSNGASTYWWPEGNATQTAGLEQVGSPPKPYTQDYYDIKSMNCAPYWLYAAFCAWDGGFLPSAAEMVAAYGTAQYPWGGTFIPNYGAKGTQYVSAAGDPLIPQPAVDNTVNWDNDSFANLPGDFYFYPNGGGLGDPPPAVNTGLDYSPFIAAPGRFFLDATAAKSSSFAGTDSWQDLGANLLEIIALANVNTPGSTTFCDCGATNTGEVSNCTCPSPGSTTTTKPGVIRATKLPSTRWVGGSWEGHETANPESRPYFSSNAYNLPIQTQYGKTGFRCARPLEP